MAGSIIPGRLKSSELTRRGKRRVRRAVNKAKAGAQKVPGPSSNPATNLLIADVVMNGASILFRQGMERAALSLRFDREKAKQVVQGRSLTESALSYLAARQATRSVPGFLLVTGGLLAKTLVDRLKHPRQAQIEGERALLEKAENAPDASSGTR
jgi:hypothetical protein